MVMRIGRSVCLMMRGVGGVSWACEVYHAGSDSGGSWRRRLRHVDVGSATGTPATEDINQVCTRQV